MEILKEALGQGIAPAIVVGVYLIIVRLIDSRKEAKRAELNSNMINLITDINKFLRYVTEDIIDKEPERLQSGLNDAFDSFSYKVCNFVIYTLVNNHIIKNKKSILDNLRKTMDKAYYDIYTVILLYNNQNNKLLTKIDKEWIYELETAVVDIIYNKELNKEQKIYHCSNKIKLYVDEYCSKLLNDI